jgi:hypothetical protein
MKLKKRGDEIKKISSPIFKGDHLRIISAKFG